MRSNREVIATVNGLELRTNTLYKVTHKPDPDAPSGYRELGATKVPSTTVANYVGCKFVETNPVTGSGIYDTGFYIESPCYGGMDQQEVKTIVANLNKYIVQPYEKLHREGDLSHRNTDFWDNFRIRLSVDTDFATSNPDKLLMLYIAMRARHLTPRSMIGNPQFLNSQYCIEDFEKVVDIKYRRNNEEIDAIIAFGELSANKPEVLVDVMNYVGLNVSSSTDDTTLKGVFREWTSRDMDNAGRFLKAVALTKDKRTEDVPTMYRILRDLFLKRVITRDNNIYYYGDTPLGVDLKTAAYELEKKEMEDIKLLLIETYDSK